ncbi:MAG: DMT family transporter [Bacteroidetes bacterium]|nr:DMT family transporter [Bacteroidota bacterium]
MKLKHWIVFILLGVIWSSSFMWIKLAIREVGPALLVAVRVSLGFLFGIVVIFIQPVKLPRTLKEWWPLLILGITNFAAPFFLITWGEKSIDSSVASILDATVPLFTIFMAHYFLNDDKVTLLKILGLLTGFAGVIILLSKDTGASSSTLFGEAAVVLASIFYAGSAVFIRKTTQNMPGILRSTIPMFSASIIMWLTAFISESPVHLPELRLTWIALLFLGIIGSGLAFLMAFYLIHEIGPTRSTMVTYIFPLGGVLLGVIFLNEQITWQLIMGGVLILLSLIVVNWKSTESKSINKIEVKAELLD